MSLTRRRTFDLKLRNFLNKFFLQKYSGGQWYFCVTKLVNSVLKDIDEPWDKFYIKISITNEQDEPIELIFVYYSIV